jgi:hypothetical protein
MNSMNDGSFTKKVVRLLSSIANPCNDYGETITMNVGQWILGVGVEEVGALSLCIDVK